MNEVYFDHEKLKVYQKAIEFVVWVHKVLRDIKTKNPTIDQFERASDSIALNIAEGNGKFSGKDRCRYFDIAKGSSLESAACLDVLHSKGLVNDEMLIQGKNQLKEVVSMIMGLIKSNSDRVYESEENYTL
ncbi:MAG: four helix bundle protein [Bacteroidetes bacterium]|nr:four helix bundle protein [Bacteroidota bacterium]